MYTFHILVLVYSVPRKKILMLSLAIMMYRSFLSVIFATNLGMVASAAFLGQNMALINHSNKRSFKSSVSMDSQDKVDLERVKDCAEHFGKCTPGELETLRDSLHQKRVRSMLLANMMGTAEAEDVSTVMEQRLLEDELNLQLDLLNHEMPPDHLFVEDETTDQFSVESDDHNMHVPTKAEATSTLMMLDEGTLEAAVFCAALGMIFMIPQFLQL